MSGVTAAPQPVRPGTVTPQRAVPSSIRRPPYIGTGGQPSGRTLEPLKDRDAIDRLRAACAAARRVLDAVGVEVRPGVTSDELDAVAHDLYVAEGGYPSPLGYRGFPKSICTSVNEVVAHGIPDDRALVDGDIVNCDITIYLDGMHGDCSATFLVGDVTPEVRELVDVTRQCLDLGVAAVRPGGRVRDIGRAIQKRAHRHGFGIVRELVGEGTTLLLTTQYLEEADQLADQIAVIDHGRVIAQGTGNELKDRVGGQLLEVELTSATLDGLPSAQFEHTVLVTDRGVDVLTA